MLKCDGCQTTDAHWYGSPRGYGGLTTCLKCDVYIIDFSFVYDNRTLMIKELRRVMAKAERLRSSNERRDGTYETNFNINRETIQPL
jgi:hypothetical protein